MTLEDKKNLLIVILLVIAGLLFADRAGIEQHPHVCTDTTHATCDGQCECDGLSCTE